MIFWRPLTFYSLLTVIEALLRKVDWKIMLTVALSFSAISLDDTGVSKANSANLLSDLHLTTDGDMMAFASLVVANQ